MDSDKCTFFMKRALELARQAFADGEVPVGCVIVVSGQVIAEARNEKEAKQDPTAHAEMIALRRAARWKGSWRLEEASVFVTSEPCPMCAGALVNARVKELYFGCRDPKGGGVASLYSIGVDGKLNHKFIVYDGILARQCGELLKVFFKARRKNG